MDYIEVMKKGRSFWWRKRAGNHRILSWSERYSRLASARRQGIKEAAKEKLRLVERTK